jgi:hypothetical protein
MEIKGTLNKTLTPETGTTKDGKAWSSQSFVINFKDGNYDKSLCLKVRSEAALTALAQAKPGDTLTVSFNAESREWNGKWYTDCVAWKIISEQPF